MGLKYGSGHSKQKFAISDVGLQCKQCETQVSSRLNGMADLLLVASVGARVSHLEFKIPAAGSGALNPWESPSLCVKGK